MAFNKVEKISNKIISKRVKMKSIQFPIISSIWKNISREL